MAQSEEERKQAQYEIRATEFINEIVAWLKNGCKGKSPLQTSMRLSVPDRQYYEKRATEYMERQAKWKEARDAGDWSAVNIHAHKMRAVMDDFVLLLGKIQGIRADARPSIRIATPRK